MIREAFEYLTTPCTPWARRLGYLSEAIAIEARHRRCAAAWDPHLQKCRETLLDTVRRHGADDLVILGSGPGLDVPLEELADMVGKIFLVDAVHPKSVRRRIARLKDPNRVEIAERDLTDMASALATDAVDLPKVSRLDWDPPGTGPVVSLNLVSQLPLCVLNHIGGTREISDDARDDFVDAVTRAHLDWLSGLGRPAILISEVERRWSDGEVTAPPERAPVARILAGPEKTWTWITIPPGERTDAVTLEAIIGLWRLA